MIQFLNKAKDKYAFHNGDKRSIFTEEKMDLGSSISNESETSQLILVNSIIKNSFDMTSYVYLLDWLHSIYLKDEPSRSTVKEKPFFEKTAKKLISSGNKNFHPDVLNTQNDLVDREDNEKFKKILEMIIVSVRQGKLEEAQKLAEYHNQYFISAMLNGGLPLNDFLIDKVEKFEKVDFELFPPFMKTKDLSELQQKLNTLKSVQINNNSIYQVYDQAIGNSNWLLWFYSIYDSFETHSSSDKYIWQIKMLQTYLCGNPSFLEKNNYNIYDSLYSNILSMLNIKIIESYSNVYNSVNNNSFLDYHFIDKEEPDLLKNYNVILKGKNIHDVINIIKSSGNYQEAIKQDWLIDLELDFIHLHFIDNSNNKLLFYETLNSILLKIINMTNSDEFDNYLKTHYNVVENSMQIKEAKLSKNEQQQKIESNIALIKLNYLKILFVVLITYYATNYLKFQIHKNESEEVIRLADNIFNNFDLILSYFYTQLFTLSLNPSHLIFVLSFCLDLETVKTNLSYLANQLIDNSSYKLLVKEIDQHFKEFQEELNTNIANNTNIYQIGPNILSVDDSLNRDLKEGFVLSTEDENKISQIAYLFMDGKLEKMTILKYILKLTLKFLANNKFNEALILVEKFNDQLNISNILDNNNLIKKYNLDKDEKNFFLLLEEISPEGDVNTSLDKNYGTDNFGVYYSVVFAKSVLDCYFNYLNLSKKVLNEYQKVSSISPLSGTHSYNILVNKAKDMIKAFKDFVRLVRILVVNNEVRDNLLSFFGEDVYADDILLILSNWTYQVFKWTADIFTKDSFKNLNLINDDR